MKTRIMAGGAAGAFLLVALAAPPPATAATNAQLSVLHGVPGVTLDNFTPGTLAGPLSLADYPIVDVSSEKSGGNPAHSGDSIVRGTL